ncbi:hypothetical protein M2341_002199 [Sphingobium sp. B7D2B]|nr:hypothetical protein [Sphingobium sp. B7D2B]
MTQRKIAFFGSTDEPNSVAFLAQSPWKRGTRFSRKAATPS